MLDTLITSKTRVRLLVKFFLNPVLSAYLRELAEEFGESTNAVRIELNRLSNAGILESEAKGKVILYRAKKTHPLFPELQSIVAKFTGIDRIVEDVIGRLGEVNNAWLVGDYAAGKDTGVIDLVLVGKINLPYLNELVEKVEVLINRRVRTIIMDEDECATYLKRKENKSALLLWGINNRLD